MHVIENPIETKKYLDYRFKLIEKESLNIRLYGRPYGTTTFNLFLKPGEEGYICGFAPPGRWGYGCSTHVCVIDPEIEYHSG